MNTESINYEIAQFESLLPKIKNVCGIRRSGTVTEVIGPIIKAQLPGTFVGEFVNISNEVAQGTGLLANVVGFTEKAALLTPFGSVQNVGPNSKLSSMSVPMQFTIDANLLGAVVDFKGAQIERIDQPKSSLQCLPKCNSNLGRSSSASIRTEVISAPFFTGLRAIDAFLTLGRGQRIGVFAEPGVGKSSLLRSIQKHSDSDVNVVALIGERNREVREAIEDAKEDFSARKTVFVVSTSDDPAICRIEAADTAIKIAEYFRDQGLNVFLQFDSLTRLLRSYREVGLAAGEMPVRRGYPPSVFVELPRLLERIGQTSKGSITGIFTVLSSGELDQDPMVEEIQGLIDGHIILSKTLAERGQYPAIDICKSLSRVQHRLVEESIQLAARSVIRRFSEIQEQKLYAERDSIEGLASVERDLREFLSQREDVQSSPSETFAQLIRLSETFEALLGS